MPAHSDDEMVSGKLTKVSARSIAIKSEMGEEKTLQIVPQTTVTIDGRDAHQSDLKEGQEVRASYNHVEGKDVAVEIKAGVSGSTGSSGSMQGGATGTGAAGSTGSSDTGSGTTLDPGSMGAGSDTGSTGSTGSSDTGSTGSTDTGSTTTPDTTKPDTTK
jgi:hypothetical protein